MIRLLNRAFCLFGIVLLSGCQFTEDWRKRSQAAAQEREYRELRETARSAHRKFREQAGWKRQTYRNEALLEIATPENTSVEISLSEQRGLLLVHGAIAMDFAVATGKRSHPTPAGDYTVLGKQSKYASNLYGKIYDATGAVVNADADSRTDSVPEGGRFEGASMPFWMRLTNSGVGMHVGYVPGRPASHGCIRLQRGVAQQLFKLVRIGTPVRIAETAPALP